MCFGTAATNRRADPFGGPAANRAAFPAAVIRAAKDARLVAKAAEGHDADLPVARMWLSMLVAFDVVFMTISLWTFEPVMTD